MRWTYLGLNLYIVSDLNKLYFFTYFFNYHRRVMHINCMGCHGLRRQNKRRKIILGQIRNSHYLGSIMPRQFFGWQWFGSNCQWSIILRWNILNANCSGTNYLGEQLLGKQFFCWGGEIIQGVTVLLPVASKFLMSKSVFKFPNV